MSTPIFRPTANTTAEPQQAYTRVLPNLYSESKEPTAVMAFGRMNPPTTGHAKLVDKMQEVGKGHHTELVVSHSQDAKKNPLSAAQKQKHLSRYFPGLKVTPSSKDEPTLIHHAKRLNQAGHKHLVFVAGSDRTHEYRQLLNKYNGKEYHFKTIKVVSAGKRDPDAEGTEGMSASKMREHAKAGNYTEFRKGVPAHVSEKHAKELYHDVRSGLSLKEEMASLHEGVHDAAIFKAVFLAGGPGSGKDFVLKKTLDGHGLTEINSDKALEFLMDKKGLSKKIPEAEKTAREEVRKKAKSMTELRQRTAIDGRNGLIINGTADDPEKILTIKQHLEDMGYSTAMVFVNTSNEISKQRNIARGERGGRTVPEAIRKDKWEKSQIARPEFEQAFGDNFHVFDNSEDLTKDSDLDPAVRKKKDKELNKIWKTIHKFSEQGPEDPAAQDWIQDQLGQQAEHEHVKKQFGLKNPTHTVDQSDAGQEAARLGLQYYGFGRYGKKGHVTHKVIQGILQPVDSKMPTPGGSSGTSTPIKESMQYLEESSETDVDRIAKKHSVSVATIMAQLEMGVQVEREHTADDAIAMQIALDHLKERPDYYTKLKQMEQQPKERLTLPQMKRRMQETTYGYDELTPEMTWGGGKEVSDLKTTGQATTQPTRIIYRRKKNPS